MAEGEYQVIALAALQIEVHYFGCASSTKKGAKGTYIGAIAVKVGDALIEIVGNSLSHANAEGHASHDLNFSPDHMELSDDHFTIGILGHLFGS